MDSIKQKRTLIQWFFGEYSWSAKLLWLIGIMLMASVVFSSEQGIWEILVDGSLNSALLVFILAYLSEFRYKYIKESRNN